MVFQDKSVTCIDCGFSFLFSAIDQEYYASRGYAGAAQRCSTCKEARTTHPQKPPAPVRREPFTITCVRCGKDTSVPGNAHTITPIYCSACRVETGFPVALDSGQEVG
jgi:CxxC-x17-CxxC domain-containing protein